MVIGKNFFATENTEFTEMEMRTSTWGNSPILKLSKEFKARLFQLSFFLCVLCDLCGKLFFKR